MTTYLLSKKVKIAGQLEDKGGFFEFDLNRDVNDSKDVNAIKEFFRLQKKSNDEFIQSIRVPSYIEEDKYQTRFIYKLDEKGKITSEKGLKSLSVKNGNSIPPSPEKNEHSKITNKVLTYNLLHQNVWRFKFAVLSGSQHPSHPLLGRLTSQKLKKLMGSFNFYVFGIIFWFTRNKLLGS